MGTDFQADERLEMANASVRRLRSCESAAVQEGRKPGLPLQAHRGPFGLIDMAKCDAGYFCESCGAYVESVVESELYLRYVMGEIPTDGLVALPDRHIRCNPELAQYIVHEAFEPIHEDRPEFDKRRKPADEVARREDLVTRAWARLQIIPSLGIDVPEYPLPGVTLPAAVAIFGSERPESRSRAPDPEGRIFF